MNKKFKTSTMNSRKDNYPLFVVTTEYPDGTKVTDYKRPNLPLYVRIALINLYDENCELKRKMRENINSRDTNR